MSPAATKLAVNDLAIGFDGRIVQHDVTFTVATGSIFAIMGDSGCGKSTLLKAMIGLIRPYGGTIRIDAEDYWAADDARRGEIGRGFGVLFQDGALWTSMSTADNVALPLTMLTDLDAAAIDELVALKLSMVGLGAAGTTMPAALSGGMRKRAGLARALALDPALLFFDEPSAGLDPISAHHLDALILDLRDGFGSTVVMVSHDLPSLLNICDDGIFLDSVTKTVIAHGAPALLRDTCLHPTVRAFLHREQAPPDPRVTPCPR